VEKNITLRTLLPQDTSAAEVSRTLRHRYRNVSRHFCNNAKMSKPFLAERNYVMLCSANGAAMVSVVCLSYVTFMHPAQTVKLFGNIFFTIP